MHITLNHFLNREISLLSFKKIKPMCIYWLLEFFRLKHTPKINFHVLLSNDF